MRKGREGAKWREWVFIGGAEIYFEERWVGREGEIQGLFLLEKRKVVSLCETLRLCLMGFLGWAGLIVGLIVAWPASGLQKKNRGFYVPGFDWLMQRLFELLY